MQAPRRRVQFELKLGSDSIDDLIASLEVIATDLALGTRGPVISGGPSSGYEWSLDEDDTITHESYFEKVRAYLEKE